MDDGGVLLAILRRQTERVPKGGGETALGLEKAAVPDPIPGRAHVAVYPAPVP